LFAWKAKGTFSFFFARAAKSVTLLPFPESVVVESETFPVGYWA
jgi:hypothetical protein